MSREMEWANEDIIEKRLRHFINKYYRVKMMQGAIITLSSALIILFVLIAFGNAFHPGTGLRNGANIIAGLLVAGVLGYYFLRPFAQRMGWVKGMNFKEASRIIQQKHKSVEDRIVNIIELSHEKRGQDNILYDFAIAQKAGDIRDFNFDEAVSFRKLGRFLFRLSVLIGLSLLTFLIWPDFIRKGIGQIGWGTEQMAILNRITFEVENDSLQVESGNDFLLRFRVQSAYPVGDVTVQIGQSEQRADPVTGGYEYLFKAVNSTVTFNLSANGVLSAEYELKTLKKPEIGGIQLLIVPPAYTELENRVIESDGNAEVPAGSKVVWSIRTVNTDALFMVDEADSISVSGKGNNWKFDKKIHKNLDYELISKNTNGLFTNYDYKITTAKDLYPTIDVAESRDTTLSNDVYIQGIIQDDYGFSKLEVVEDKSGRERVSEIEIKKSSIYDQFYYTIIPDTINTVYFFRVWDNDQVTGPKFTESRKISIRTITRAEIEDINSQLVDSIKTSVADGMSAIEKMEKKVSEFRMEQVLGELKPWEIQDRLKELNELKNEVVDFLNNISETDKEFTENEQLLNQDNEFAERAKEIQDLMQNLLDDELKDLLKEFEELAKEFNAAKADEMTEKMEMNLEKLKEQMEMSLELLKKYEMEKDLMKQIEELNQMADSVQSSNPEKNDTANSLKNQFEKWEKNYEKNLQQDKDMKKPMGLEDMEKEREEVKEAAEDLEKNEDSKSDSQKKSKASKSLKSLAKKMENMLGMKSGEALSVDLEDLRQIRNSLNDFSMKQEDLNNRISRLNTVSPTFTTVMKGQKELETKFIGVKDSLKSLGYRQPIIAKVIGSELFHVEASFKNLFESYSGSRANVVRIEQNKIMTEINSIAVKLDELISSMENVKGSGSGSGEKGFTDSKKPKEGEQQQSDKIGETEAKQQSLKDQLKSAIEKMKAGQNGKKERGEMARMLGEREMMRKAFEKLLQDGGMGKDAKEKANQALNMMKEVEKDIIYNRLGDNTLKKDNMITTRLLEAENAERERENENRRESKEFKGSFEPNRVELDPTADPNKALQQMLKYNELKLKRFYQEKYLKYIESTKK